MTAPLTAPTTVSQPRASTAPPTPRVTPVIAVLVVSAFVMILNETVLSVALPQLMGDFGVDAVAIQWLTTGFLLTMAVVIPTTGYLIQRFKIRTLFIAALTLFAIGTLVAALAPTFEVMLTARVIQAAGTAIILPLLMTTTLTYVAPHRRGTIMGLNSVVISVGPAIGPTLSGAIISAWGWRALFGIMLVVAALALAAGLRFIRLDNDTRRVPFDVFSVALSAFAFGGLVYALATISTALQGAWIPTLIAAGVGVAGLAWFVARQRFLQRADRALLDLRPLGVATFRRSVIVVMAAMATMLGTVIVIPITMQVSLGASILTTGLLLLPGGLIQGIASPIIGNLYDRFGPRPLVIPGAVLFFAGQVLLATVSTATPLALVVTWHVIFCLGMALIMTPLMTLSLSALPRHQYGHGSAIMNTLQQLSGAVGTALLITGMSIGAGIAATSGSSAALAQIQGHRVAFTVGTVLALVTLVVAPMVKRLPVPQPEQV